jgi:hypothetical protein
MDRTIVPVGTEIECYDTADDHVDDMPVYSGTPEDAFMSIEPGLYPGSFVTETHTEGGFPMYGQVQCLLVVTPDESFAVTTAVQYADRPMPVDTSLHQ